MHRWWPCMHARMPLMMEPRLVFDLTRHPVTMPHHHAPSPCPIRRYLQLATVQPDGRPANRTVVFRWASYCPPTCRVLEYRPSIRPPSATVLNQPRNLQASR